MLNEIQMARYYIDSKGFDEALTERYLPTLIADPAISAAIIQRENAKRAIEARITEIENATDVASVNNHA